MKKLLRIAAPVLLASGALLGGAAAGDLLRQPSPAPDQGGGEAASAAGEPAGDAQHDAAGGPGANGTAVGHGDARSQRDQKGFAYLKFPQQFFVPIVRNGNLQAVMVLALSLEIPTASEEAIFRQEHRLRDALLRRLLIHANSGGFDGNFTAEPHLELLRGSLLAEAQRVSGPDISAVLIGDIARQQQ